MAAVTPGSEGEKKALLEQMVTEQPGRLSRKMRAAGYDAVDADDLAQETLTRALRSIAQVRGPADEALLCGWVDRIATNLIRNHRRDAARRPTSAPLEPTDDADPADDRFDVDQVACRASLESLLSVLPDDQRHVFVACVLEERTTAEVATDLGVSADLVRWRLRRARERLRAQVEQIA